jgi:hypothetical protein
MWLHRFKEIAGVFLCSSEHNLIKDVTLEQQLFARSVSKNSPTLKFSAFNETRKSIIVSRGALNMVA